MPNQSQCFQIKFVLIVLITKETMIKFSPEFLVGFLKAKYVFHI